MRHASMITCNKKYANQRHKNSAVRTHMEKKLSLSHQTWIDSFLFIADSKHEWGDCVHLLHIEDGLAWNVIG